MLDPLHWLGTYDHCGGVELLPVVRQGVLDLESLQGLSRRGTPRRSV